MIRPFILRDLPTLHRYRRRGLFLDTTTALTWGPSMVPAGALLTHFAPATGIFTYLGRKDRHKKSLVLAQVVHHGEATCARFSFLGPESALESPAFPELVDYLAAHIGERGAHNLVADVEEGTLIYEVLRRTGFAIYARQRIWRLEREPAPVNNTNPADRWRSVIEKDAMGLRVLYNSVVPGLTQQVETPPWQPLRGLVLRQEGEVRAYADLTYGPRGIVVQPFFHPEVEHLGENLTGMLRGIPNRRSRPVFLRIRSYQGWLEAPLEELAAEPGPRQAVMVKRLAVTVKKPVIAPLPAIKGTTATPTMPITRSIKIMQPNGK